MRHRSTAPRSRAIWDETRSRPHHQSPSIQIASSYLRAILYELQPVRFSTIDIDNQTLSTWKDAVISMFHKVFREVLPKVAAGTYEFLKRRSLREWMVVAALFSYWKLVVFLHRLLDAGPMVLILSALVAIFTVGLGNEDDRRNNADRRSAYAVFNRGFENILGGVDVENLVAQYAGGAMALGGGQHREENNIDELRHQQQRNENHGREREQGQENEEQQQQEARPENRSRRSNKKSRRKQNLELRREMRRQREAAAAMGFGADRNDGHMNENEVRAMNILVEEQAEAALGENED